ncbi:hypothetical protein TI03_01065 [Achromatium sp. WMS1]|nr:hypothetical protein TI03_01065 [Achromatium sp. WMS1]
MLGASSKIERYANMAQKELTIRGYHVIPVHPKIPKIYGITVVPELHTITQPVHTLTMYIGASRSEPLLEDILKIQPSRVIFNPGSESLMLETQLQQQNIMVIRACTLVLLRTQQF